MSLNAKREAGARREINFPSNQDSPDFADDLIKLRFVYGMNEYSLLAMIFLLPDTINLLAYR